MQCDLTTSDHRTFTCRRCGRSVTFRRRQHRAILHLQCGVASRRPNPPAVPIAAPATKPPRAKPVAEAEANTAVLLATIRAAGLPDLPPWPAIERHARHVCETGAWAGCERQRQDWARRVVELASTPGLWPAAWGEYPTAPTP